ncbi:TetR/AcrR family transcriptional regulator [Noviherbaspirillum galbum]|uniref:TetR/AcrR family transcriptional regulator n=1 Tax=Noviherbaspirillum galbum TaxID=2709383 RepID=A0A6B3ST76_9BURK|nr:TetR/AcrR family transcriptional regulator [Noviherbaspirillum galbum]NEX62535.1 TetR/AcrR family transcriptional regulator [Noviherbaspirillum galbum]
MSARKPVTGSKSASEGKAEGKAAPAPRRRLPVEEREKQILAGAIQFFAQHGFDGQTRVLAQEIGITHALLYHYFPSKQALIERVYVELFESRWKTEWETLLDADDITPEDKLVRFYCDYASSVLTREFVRIFVYSGLSDHYITDNFFNLLREKLFPRLVRETRRYAGVTSRAKPSDRELELLLGLHGGIFYTGVRRWIYGQQIPARKDDPNGEGFIADRVQSYLLTASSILEEPKRGGARTRSRSPRQGSTETEKRPASPARTGKRIAGRNAKET